MQTASDVNCIPDSGLGHRAPEPQRWSGGPVNPGEAPDRGPSRASQPDRLESARRRAQEAQGALERYLRHGFLDLELHRQLADALRIAIDDYIDKLSDAVAG